MSQSNIESYISIVKQIQEVVKHMTKAEKQEKIFQIYKEGEDTFAGLNVSLLNMGLFEKLTGNEFKVLFVILSSVERDGTSTIAQSTIASKANLAKSTVLLAVNSIVKKKFNGNPIMAKRIIGKGVRSRTIYTFPDYIGQAVEQDTTEDRMTAPQVMKYFQDRYVEQFGIEYKPSYARDLGLIKRTIMTLYTDEQIKAIIDFAVKEYDKRWRTPQYTTITIGALCGWIAQATAKVLTERKHTVQDREAKYAELDTDDDIEL